MASGRSRLGLNGLNVCIAAVQTGFGPFIAVYLTEHGWRAIDIGFALSAGTLAAMASQLPAGALVDVIPSKRLAVAVALSAVGASALLLAMHPARVPVMAAEIVHGFASCMIGPAVAAITLAIYGHVGLGERLGRNAQFAAIGGALGAAAMGAFGKYISSGAVLVLTAFLALPALAMLALIRLQPPEAHDPDIHHAALLPRSRRPERPWRIFRNRGLLVFAAAAGLFFVGNAALLPLAANVLSRNHDANTETLISAAIVVPMAITALMSPWIGRLAERLGRRPVLLLGFTMLPLRALLLAAGSSGYLLVPVQALDGITGAVFGVMVPLVAADVTRRSGSLTLGMAAVNLAIGLGASISTSLAGAIAQAWGDQVAFLTLATAGAASVLLLLVAMPETRPKSHPARSRRSATTKGFAS